MAKFAIKIQNLCKSYSKSDDGFHMKNINLEVLDKQFITILGPSGCGKSVLMNLLCGIEKPTSGTITYYGNEFTNGVPSKFRRKIGFAFQDNNLLDWRTTEKNLMFPMECFRLKNSIDCKARIDEVLKLVGLEDFKKAYPHELSGGMKQRVGFARALMHDPPILLLDQPFGALDAITRKILNYDLLNIWKKTQKTIIMVTNSVEEAILLSSKAIFLSKDPVAVQTEIDINIPLEARDQNIVEYPGYAELKEKMEYYVHNLNIETDDDRSDIEA